MSIDDTAPSDGRARVERFLATVAEATTDPSMQSTLTPDPRRAAEVVAMLEVVAGFEDAVVELIGLNGTRVDVKVTAADREWWVVLAMDRDGVHWATQAEKPGVFAGVTGGCAVLLRGPSSVGKSTLMTAVCERARSPWVRFDEL
jgi:hypothetical protein